MDENRRIRWGRWVGLAFLLLLLGTVAFVGVAGSVHTRYLRQRIAELRQAGDPMLPSDFAPVKVADSENAALELDKAAALLAAARGGPAWKAFYALDESLPLRPDELETINTVVRGSAEALARVEKARSMPQMEPQFSLSTPMIQAQPHMPEIRSLELLLGSAALVDHEAGNDALAMQRLDRMLFVSRYPERAPTLIGHLVAIGGAVRAADRAAMIAPDLRIGQGRDDVSPDDLRRFIGALLDDRAASEGLIRGLRGERMMQIDTIDAIASGVLVNFQTGQANTSWNFAARYAVKPFYYRNLRIMVEYMTQLIAEAQQTDWPTAKSRLPAPPARSLTNAFTNLFLASFDRPLLTHYRAITDRRLAATALAIRWYTVEHDGTAPQKLADLVPKYLPAVPIDPMAAGGKPLVYLPREGSPIIYSVGSDGIDDGGSEADMRPRPNSRSLAEWNMKDRVLHLTRQPRSPVEDETDAAGGR